MSFTKKFAVSFMAVMVCLLISSGAWAGFFWESVEESSGIPGHASGKRIIKHYLAENAFRTDRGSHVNIMDFKTMKMYRIDHQKKTYSKMNINQIGQRPGMSEEEAEQLQGMMKSIMGSMKIVRTDETKKIGPYNCTKVMVTFMMTNTEHWVSKEVPHYDEILRLGKKMSEKFSHNAMFQHMSTASMIAKMKGFPVRTITKTRGGTSTTTVKEIVKKDLGSDLFKVPEGYSEIPMQ